MSHIVGTVALFAVLVALLCYPRNGILGGARRRRAGRETDGEAARGPESGSLPRIRVQVYGKRDCCLCEEVKATLAEVRRDVPFDLQETDIESNPEIYEAYKDRIPLVTINGRPAFKFRMDGRALRRRLARESERLRGGVTRGPIG